jgi:hypothetical protein
MSSKQIRQLVETLEHDIHSATSSEQILAAVGKIKAFRKPLVYKHSTHFLAAVVSLSIAVFIFVGSHYQISFLAVYSQGNGLFFLGIGCLLLCAFIVSLVFKNKHQISKIAKLAYQKDAMLDNKLKFKAPFNSEEMRIRFSELNRGNHSRTFKEVVAGEYQGDEHQFTFEYYHFHYVDKRTVVTMRGKRMRTKTVYDKYDRYGIIIPFGFYQNLQIFSFKIGQLAQGYGIAKPMLANDIPEWLANWEADDSWQV